MAVNQRLQKRVNEISTEQSRAISEFSRNTDDIITSSDNQVVAILNNSFARRRQLRDFRNQIDQRIVDINRQYVQATQDVLDDRALQFLVQHSNINAPTLTSIFAGFELAKAARAERMNQQREVEVARLNDARENQTALTEAQIARDESFIDIINQNRDDRLNREGRILTGRERLADDQRSAATDTSINRNRSAQGVLDQLRRGSDATTPSSSNTVIDPTDVSNNAQAFNQLGIPEDRHELAQTILDRASQSPLAAEFPNFPQEMLLLAVGEQTADPLNPTEVGESQEGDVGGVGIFQLTSIAAEDTNLPLDQRTNPVQNIDAAIRLAELNADRLDPELRSVRNIVLAHSQGAGGVNQAGGEIDQLTTVNATEAPQLLARIDESRRRLTQSVTVDQTTQTTSEPIESQRTRLGETLAQIENQLTRTTNRSESLRLLDRQRQLQEELSLLPPDDLQPVADTTTAPLIAVTTTTAPIADNTTLAPVSVTTTVQPVVTTTAAPEPIDEDVLAFRQATLDRAQQQLNDLTDLNIQPTVQDAEDAVSAVLDLSDDEISLVTDQLNQIAVDESLEEAVFSPQTVVGLNALNDRAGTNITTNQLQSLSNSLGVSATDVTLAELLQRLRDREEELGV